MSDQYRGRRDFSDIDNLDRATESFLKEQHRALAGSKAVRAPRNRTEAQFNAMKYARIGGIAAVIMLIVGVGIFAGIKFGSRNDGLIKPEPDKSPAVEVVTDTTTAETEVTEIAEDTAPAVTQVTTTKKTKATTTVTTAPQTVSQEESSSVTPASSATTSSTTRPTSTVTTVGGADASSQHASTTTKQTTTSAARTTTKATTTVTTKTTAKITAKATTNTTAKTTAKATTTKATTTKTTTTTTKTTTTPKPTTTTTTTTTAAKANISVQGVSVGSWENYNNGAGCSQILTITVKNTGNAAQTDVRKIAIQCSGGGSVIHAAATSGNTSGAMTYYGETIYVPYSGKLAAGATDTITVRVITNEAVWSCGY